jgi:hypothetical protein
MIRKSFTSIPLHNFDHFDHPFSVFGTRRFPTVLGPWTYYTTCLCAQLPCYVLSYSPSHLTKVQPTTLYFLSQRLSITNTIPLVQQCMVVPLGPRRPCVAAHVYHEVVVFLSALFGSYQFVMGCQVGHLASCVSLARCKCQTARGKGTLVLTHTCDSPIRN